MDAMAGDGFAPVDWPFMQNNWPSSWERRQVKRLRSDVESLLDSFEHERVENQELRSAVARMGGSLEQRLGALTRSFEAFVELSDIRTTLADFEAAALVRRRARQLLAGLAEPTDVPFLPDMPDDNDVRDYWLAPAARALTALLRGADASADIGVAERLDRSRAALLITATTSLAGRRDLAGEWLPAALGDLRPGVSVPSRQRLLWIEAARGAFGPAGAELIAERLSACVAVSDVRGGSAADAMPGAASIDDAIRQRLAEMAEPVQRLAVLDGNAELKAAFRAGAQLTALRQLCIGGEEPARRSRAEDDAASVRRSYARLAPAPTARAGHTAPGRTATGPDRPAEEPEDLGALVRYLVDEGSQPEIPLLRRADELSAILQNHRPPADPWNQSVGTAESLLLNDAFDTTDAATGRLARRVLHDRLTRLAGELAAATDVDVPAEIAVNVGAGTVRVTATGADQRDVAAARTEVAAKHRPEPLPDRATWTLIGIAAVVIVAGIPLATELAAVIGGILLCVAGVRIAKSRSYRTQEELELADATTELDRRIAAAAAGYETTTRRLAEVRAQASADLNTVGRD